MSTNKHQLEARTVAAVVLSVMVAVDGGWGEMVVFSRGRAGSSESGSCSMVVVVVAAATVVAW